MKRITTTDLASWANSRDGQEHLPLLIRKLIRASAAGTIQLQFPCGDNVILKGWDGIMSSSAEGTNIPAGDSVWELGCRKDHEKKAQDDYAKRTAHPTGVCPELTTYVAVTPYIWPGKQDWITEKIAEGIWKDVRVIDGLILEEWIEINPVVDAWFYKFLGNPDILPLDDFWDEWSTGENHRIPDSLVVSGRQKEAQQLLDFLSAPPKVVVVKSLTIDESIAFVAATIHKSSEAVFEDTFARAVRIDNETDFRHTMNTRSPLVLIANFPDGGIVYKAVRNGHHVIVPLGMDTTATTAEINLARIGREGMVKSLRDMGYSLAVAETLAKDTGHSLSVLRRLLQFEKNRQPEWAKNRNHLDIIPALLAGSWNEDKEGDRETVSLLAGEPYEKYISRLSTWLMHKDAPIIQVKSRWRMTSSLDAMSILGPFLLKKDLELFRKVFISVFSKLDPALELPLEKRYLASMYGKTSDISSDLKEGLCQTLVLLAIFGDKFKVNCIASIQDFAGSIVHDILSKASGDGWCSLSRYLPAIAEASPEIFLRRVEFALNQETTPIQSMFQEYSNLFSHQAYHTGLLWALESLAVSSEYFLKVSIILCKLAQLDPGGRLVNRPFNSLRHLYLPWFNQTEMPLVQKKTVLEHIVRQFPDIAWGLMLKLLPDPTDVAFQLNHCHRRFREQIVETQPAPEEITDFHGFLIDRLLHLAGHQSERLVSLTIAMEHLSLSAREKILEYLSENKNLLQGNPHAILDGMRNLLARHRQYSDENWALQGAELGKIEAVFTQYKPTGLIEESLFLFDDDQPEFPDGRLAKIPVMEWTDYVNTERKKALSIIYEQQGLAAIIRMIGLLNKTSILGQTAGKLNLFANDETELFQVLIANIDESIKLFIRGYVSSKSQEGGNEWVQATFSTIKGWQIDADVILLFFLGFPQTRYTWTLLSQEPAETIDKYWKTMEPWIYQLSKEEKLYALSNLLRVRRQLTALHTLSFIADQFTSEELTSIVRQATTGSVDEKRPLQSFHIGRIFAVLHQNNDLPKSTILELEWLYMPFLTDIHSNIKPKNVLAELSASPSYFIDVIELLYKGDNARNIVLNLSDEEEKARQRQFQAAWHLLDRWTVGPGMDEANAIDEKALQNWVTDARSIAAERGQLYGADTEIGKLFSSYPKDQKIWPSEAICKMIDIVGSDTMISSFQTGIINSRGVIRKAPREGGQQERSLAAYYERMAEYWRSKYPLTAAALKYVASRCTAHADEEDDRAQISELKD